MPRIPILLILMLLLNNAMYAQLFKKPVITGLYLEWGYNRDWYSPSDIHFTNGDQYDFTVHNALATDRPSFHTIWQKPLDITIPQNSVRLGFYLSEKHTKAIEINFDHAKYIMQPRQRLRLTGFINDRKFDKDTLIHPYFLSFEHTNGANFFHVNYVQQIPLLHLAHRNVVTAILKTGAGLVVPKSDVFLMGRWLDNKYHVAGYIISGETGIRLYPLRKLFLEFTAKGGYANYLNSLTMDGGRAHHHFYYLELIGLVGYDIHF